MASHVRILGWLHIVLGSLGVLAAMVILLFFGGVAGIVAMAEHSPDARVAIPILGGIGSIASFVVLMISLPGVIAGIGLLQFRSWARILTIILSALELIHVPLGTALGIYGLWVLLSRGSEQLFS